METNPKDNELLGTKESAIDAENASFILGNENVVSPQKYAAEVTPNPCTPDNFQSPLDFSTVTIEQLGIKSESFVNNSSGKSSPYRKKSRRRSTVGVRGSPETNNLICFIAQQRNLKNTEKSPLTQNFPFLGSPVLYRNVNSLRERISAFQSAFHSIEEKEKLTHCPEFSEAEGVLETTDLTKKESHDECLPSALPTQLSKHRRISSQSNSVENLTKGIDLQMFNIAAPPNTDRTYSVETSLADLSEKSSEPGLALSGHLVKESVPLSELTEACAGTEAADCAQHRGVSAIALGASGEVSTGPAPAARSLVAPQCERDAPPSETLALRSVLKKPSVKLCLESLQEHCNNLCDNETHPSLISTLANCCKEQKAEGQENYKVPAFVNMRKRKRVTFGEDLSPEVFDESLPANTPLRKGETPVRKKEFGGITPLLLEQSPVPEQLPQPIFDDKGENLENIEPPQVSFAVASPLSKSSVSETLSGTDTLSSSNSHEKITCKGGRRTRASNRKNQLISSAEESVCSLLNTETQPCKEKKPKRRKAQESKHTDRVLPKRNPIPKRCRKKKAKRKKVVQQTLYGERDIASRKPLLSPIPELPEMPEVEPEVPGSSRKCSDDFNSNGELQDMKLPERKNLFCQNSEDLQMNQEFSECGVSEFCSSYIKSSLSLINATFNQESNINTVGIHRSKIIPKAEIKLESENDLKTVTEIENSHISGPSVTEKLMSSGPQSDFIVQFQGFSAAGENVEDLSQSFNFSGAIKGEPQDDFLVAARGELQTEHLTSGLHKECDYSEGVLIISGNEKKSQSENLGRNCAESGSGVSCEGERRRRSRCYPGGQHLHLEKNGIHTPFCSVGSSVEISLENSELYKDLSDSIEQTFQRTSRETKVRRSTRLQKDLENEGLVWISLPFPSTSCPSQRTKRRTLHTFDSRELESMSPRKKTVLQTKTKSARSISDQEKSEGFAASSSSLRGKRRKSFCTSALADIENTKSKC